MPRVGPGVRDRPTPDVSHHMLFAAPVYRRQPATHERGPDLARRVAAAHVAVRVVDVGDPAAQRVLLDDTAGGVDLRKFGHERSCYRPGAYWTAPDTIVAYQVVQG